MNRPNVYVDERDGRDDDIDVIDILYMYKL